MNATIDVPASHFLSRATPTDVIRYPHHTSWVEAGCLNADTYLKIQAEKIEIILSILESRQDGEVMIWSDINVTFNPNHSIGDKIVREINDLSCGKDILLLRHYPAGTMCNPAFKIIRRNTKTLIFYAQLKLMMLTLNRSERSCLNRLLEIFEGLAWGTLPITYSCASNRGLSPDSRILYLNTSQQSMQSVLLAEAAKVWRKPNMGKG